MPVQNAENHMCIKGTWSATGSSTTNWMMDLVSLIHSVIRNLPCLMIYIIIRTVFYSSEEKNFKCETCKRLFAHKRSLEPGRYTCTVSAQDVCGHCGTVFKSRGSLEDHARSHDGSLPYPCNKCLVLFTYRNQLRRHSKTCLS